jgi:cytidylate kinase
MAIVTISREYGSGGSFIAKAVADAMNYAFIDKKTIAKEIKKLGPVWAKWEDEIDESGPSIWERFDRSFIGIVALEEKALLEAALQDNCVIVGRGGHWLLRDIPNALHIRLVGALEDRVARIAEVNDVSHDQALHFIKRADLDRSRYLRMTYNVDWADPLQFDAVLDTSRLSYEEVTQFIIKLIPEKDKHVTEESKLKLKQRTIAARVRAAVLKSPDIFIPTIEVIHDGTAVIMNGIVKHAAERKLAEDVAREAAGDEPFISKLHYRM